MKSLLMVNTQKITYKYNNVMDQYLNMHLIIYHKYCNQAHYNNVYAGQYFYNYQKEYNTSIVRI